MCLEMGSRLDRLRSSLICARSIADDRISICLSGLEGLNNVEHLRTLPAWCRKSCERSQRLREEEKEIYQCMIYVHGTLTGSEPLLVFHQRICLQLLFCFPKCDVSTDSSDA